MQALKAVVRNGRPWSTQATELPEGTEVELLPIVFPDGLDEAERARLVATIEAGFADIELGDHVDGFELAAELRARREAAGR